LKVIAHDKAIQQWTFTNVFPSKVTGPNLKGEGNDISVETIEITAEGMAIDCVHATVNAPLVHLIKLVTEAAGRHPHLYDVGKVFLDCLGAVAAFVAGYAA
jgi:hypothetical protein